MYSSGPVCRGVRVPGSKIVGDVARNPCLSVPLRPQLFSDCGDVLSSEPLLRCLLCSIRIRRMRTAGDMGIRPIAIKGLLRRICADD